MIDNCTKKIWVHFLKNKLEMLKFFKEFKAEVETQSGYKIKIVKSDKGGEYNLGEFLNFYKLNEIKREFTSMYTPQ